MQAPPFINDGSIRLQFNTKQILGDIEIPLGNHGAASWQEAITVSYPQYGLGGATQAITKSPIRIDQITNLNNQGVIK